MLKYQTDRRRKAEASRHQPRPATTATTIALAIPMRRTSSESAAQAQSRGFAFFQQPTAPVRRAGSMFEAPFTTADVVQAAVDEAGPSPAARPRQRSSIEEKREEEARRLEEDRHIVQREFTQYLEQGITVEMTSIGQLCYWEASAVACERMFSSSKETCTLRRNRLSPRTIEALQVLKYSIKQSRLNFTDHLVAKEEHYRLYGPVSDQTIEELVATDQLEELASLFDNSELTA
ncbi:hypothetical protein D9611_000970 [Ephemerocybe angulata]|uniref:HAT C-terminal dimerisation domain-containing protein n=1 Tax=Ephemerocybe angulata TaxID=980116 RepID=A0A8H5F6U3_9AGAR|nr:hypothetical protein D9611_000970 [Tulosesus angulatus]